MTSLVGLLTLINFFMKVIICDSDKTNITVNSTDPNKDMYVIHAMVYQVGIITNKTDDKHLKDTTGNQEALTLYRTNGSKFDLSRLPAPLLTNVTAQTMVQVAPKHISAEHDNMGRSQISWNDIKKFTSLPKDVPNGKLEGKILVRRSLTTKDELSNTKNMRLSSEFFQGLPQTVVNFEDRFKRELADDKTTIKVVKGAAVIPQEALVQSIAIPPLVALNNNLSDIPVPIPNTSLVRYTKINTVLSKA